MSIATTPSRAGLTDPRARDAPAPRGRFADALARAGAARVIEGASAGAVTPKGRASGSARPVPPPRGSPWIRQQAVETAPPDLPPCGSPPPGRAGPSPDAEPGVAELRAAVRAAPAAITSSLRAGGAQLALSFGAALSLDLRAGSQGLELTLRPAAGLERVTRAELPGLVEALRAQGLRVARAEVRPRAPATPRRAR